MSQFTNNPIDDAQNKLIIDAMHNDLLSYALGINPSIRSNRFAKALCWEIQNALEGNCDRLMIFAPPRHGKTLFTSETAPAWFMGRNPEKKIICASHTATLAEALGAKVRNNIANPVHEAVFGRAGALDPKKAASGEFKTLGGGEYYAVGVGGTPIGKGAHAYIIDDPIRSRADVESPGNRESLKNWYSSSVLTRLEGLGTVILMHQRWHDDDLAGWLINEAKNGGDRWRIVNFPAIIEDDEDFYADYLQRDLGEVLIPELHSKEKLQRLKRTLHPRDWLSMYQQRPRGEKGDEFVGEMLARYQSPPYQMRTNMNVYIIVDPADGQTNSSDYTVMSVIGLGTDGNFYILDMVRDRLDLNGRTDTLMELHRRWRPLNTYYEKIGMQSDIQHIKYVQEQVNYRFPIVEIKNLIAGNSVRGKNERIRRLVPDMTAQRWYAPEELIKINKDGEKYDPIKAMVEEEMEAFPVGVHDDALDCISRIYDVPVLWPSGGSSLESVSSGNKISPW